MIEVAVAQWSAWAPGVAGTAAWRGWCQDPAPLEALGDEGLVVPERLTRRCTRLTKMMLHVAMEALGDRHPEQVRTVFASRHGSMGVAVGLVRTILHGEPVSPLDFTHSVHNAQAGVFSIATGNRQGSLAVAAGEETFAAGYLEAALSVRQHPDRPTLLVVADEPLPEPFRSRVAEPHASYALGLLLEAPVEGEPVLEWATSIRDDLGPVVESEIGLAHPTALGFLRWWVGAESEWTLCSKRRRTTFRRR